MEFEFPASFFTLFGSSLVTLWQVLDLDPDLDISASVGGLLMEQLKMSESGEERRSVGTFPKI